MEPQWQMRYRSVSYRECAESYDALVVGAGPAGIMAAVECARTCKSVLLVEAGSLPREKSCGGMLNRYSLKALEPYGAVPECMVLDPRWINFRYFHMDHHVKKATKVRFLNVDRTLFDAWLLSLLPENVSVLAQTPVASVSQTPRGVEAYVRVRGERELMLVRASYLVAADGPRATVRECLGLRPFDRYLTVQEYMRIEPGALEPYFDCVCSRAFPREYGIGYLMPKGPVAIVGSVFYPGTKHAERKHEEVLELLKRTYPLGEAVKREVWMAAHVRRPADLVAGQGRILLAGEGGGFLSCTSGEGISFALNSGIRAGKAVAAAVASGERDADGALARYERSLAPMKRNLAFRMAMFPFMNSAWGKDVACVIPTPLVSKATERL